MSTKNPIDRIAVNSPCSNDWDSMIGNDQVRFCEHCSLQVHNLSEMTQIDAMRLLARSSGRLCVRYYRNPNGETVTRNTASALHQIGRRASRIASAAFSATLSLTPALAHASTNPTPDVVYYKQAERSNPSEGVATISGTISDPNGAVIAGANVSVSNSQTGLALTTITNDAGEFRFEGLPSGTYMVLIEAPGFSAFETGPVMLRESSAMTVDRTLSVAPIESVTVGVMALPSPKDPLVRAAQEDNLEAVETLVAKSDVNLRDEVNSTTALEHAVMNGNREMVQLLIAHGANVNAKGPSGHTVLMILGEDVTSDLVWDLINAGAKLDQQDADGNTAMINLAHRNNVDVIKTLLDAGAKVNLKNKQGQTALMIAASNGMINNVRALVLAGANLNDTDNDGKNALSYALEGEKRAIIRFLRARGAIEVPVSSNEAEVEE